MRNASYDTYQAVARPVIAIANHHPTGALRPAHHHQRAQLFHALAGVISVDTREGAWVAPPGRGVWIPEGVTHAVHLRPGSRACNMWFDPGLCPNRGPGCEVLEIAPLLDALIGAAVDLPAEYDEGGRDGLVMRLLAAEVDRAPTVPLTLPFPRSRALGRLCTAYLAAPRINVTIEAWSTALGLERRAFTRAFRRETGMSFGAWRQQACLLAALPRLAQGDSVTAVALDLGYDAPAAFSTSFKRRLGTTPSAYRAQAQGDPGGTPPA
ncbi:AraC family transcriptional regulator [Pararhodospirillum oryzae]|uniref:Transcriptional regulator n=1 Tax=Pararhodospirillum oryzae TaxID=478448 RepID=A0A512H449_9PROT|nr:helix-turn-helix transcriptional regulator [Pararhodospirillum oryzae]GEO80160.1 transcriptional regulator [Pararhodospirillum oryzae]